MNRFRRKSESRKSAKSINSDSSPPPLLVNHLRRNLLPQDDFRTSLILPHLTRRFTLLRSDDGQLVSYDTMQQNLEAQQRTGALSSVEVEAVLAQYRLQSIYEQQHLPPTATHDAIPFPYSASSSRFRTESVITTNTSISDLDSATSISHSSSTPPLPRSRSAGGGNSMFGGRVPSRAQLRMPKSPSSRSVRSSGGSGKERERTSWASGRRRMTSEDGNEEEKEFEESEERERTSSVEEDGQNSGQEQTGEEDEEEDSSRRMPGHLLIPTLSEKQLRRISLALDTVAADLSPIYRIPTPIGENASSTNSYFEADLVPTDRTPSPTGDVTTSSNSLSMDEEPPLSPASPTSDTEAIDPFVHRIAPNFPLPPPRTPSPRTNSDPNSLPRDLSSHSLQRDSSTPQEPSHLRNSSTSQHQHQQRNSTFTFSGGPRQRKSSNTCDSRPTSSNISASTTSHSSFAAVSRHGGHFSGSGPFDFDFDNSPNHSPYIVNGGGLFRGDDGVVPEAQEEEEEEGEGEGVAAVEKDSHSRSSSIGSSYHPAMGKGGDDDDDSLLFITNKKKLSSSSVSTSPPSSDLHSSLRPVSMSRKPSEELIEEIKKEGGGDEIVKDLVVEDLVVLQEALVKSAGVGAVGRKYPLEDTVEEKDGLGFTIDVGQDGEKDSKDDYPEEEEAESKRLSLDSEDGRSPQNFMTPEMWAYESDDHDDEEEDADNESLVAASNSSNSTTPSMMINTPSFISDAFEFSGNLHQDSVVGAVETEPEEAEEELEELLTAVIPVDVVDPTISPSALKPSVTPSPTLAAALELVEPIPARVPRTTLLPPRNPAATQSVLIRDVRNQANAATMNLKKQQSPKAAGSVRRTKSIRNTPISNPHLIQAPEGISVVPIKNRFDDYPVRSPSMKKEERASKNGSHPTGKSGGIGLRFKMLLKKQGSRDNLKHLNGDEVTPFVEFGKMESPQLLSTPFTPPEQTSARFGPVPSNDYPTSPEYPETPTQDDYRSPSLLQVSPAISTSSGSTKSLGRFVSRFRRPRGESDASSRNEDHLHRSGSARSSRRPSETSIGHAVATGSDSTHDSGRAPTSYEIGSPRSDSSPRMESNVPLTAPLSPQRRHLPEPLAFSSATTSDRSQWSTSNSAPLLGARDGRESLSSMRKLRDAAESLGMAPDSAQEFVELSYGHSPTSSTSSPVASKRSGHHPRSSSANDGSFYAHFRSDSQTSTMVSGGLQQAHSEATSRARSIHNRTPTPPPGLAHFSKDSEDFFAGAGSVPTLPSIPSGATGTTSSSDGDSPQLDRRMSKVSGFSIGAASSAEGSLRPPRSPGVGSFDSRSSHYAGSIYDLYGGDSTSEAGVDVGTTLPSEVPEEEAEDQVAVPQDGAVIWQVVGGLKGNRLSTERYSFHSRKSSTNSEDYANDPTPYRPALSAATSESIQQFLRNNPRAPKAKPPLPFLSSYANDNGISRPSNRFPSIFLRDEERLQILAKKGGIASEEQGIFMVRPARSFPEDGSS